MANQPIPILKKKVWKKSLEDKECVRHLKDVQTLETLI